MSNITFTITINFKFVKRFGIISRTCKCSIWKKFQNYI